MLRNGKTIVLIAISVALAAGVFACKPNNSKGAKSELDSLAMARGLVQGQNFGQQVDFSIMMGQQIDKEQLLKGMKEGMSHGADSTKMWYFQGLAIGYQMAHDNFNDKVSNKLFEEYFMAAMQGDSAKLTWPQEELMVYIEKAEMKLYEEKQKAKEEEQKELHKANIEEGEKFLAEYKEKEGVVVLPSGVAYKTLQEGTGSVKPTTDDTVEVRYVGRLIDGTEFDKSGEEPTSFGVSGVIAGWTEVLQEMTVGQKVEVVIPYDKAYGAVGSGNSIEPYKTLIFEIELIGIKNPETK